MRKSVIHSLVMGAASLALALACSPAPSGDDSAETGGTNSGGSKSGGSTASGGTKTGGSSSSGGSTSTGGDVSLGGSCGDPIGDLAENVGFTVGATVYSYSDEAGSCITGTLADGEACVHGTAAQVVDDQWSTIWGAGLGINLVDPDGAVDLSEYDGFSFNFSGTLPAELRVSVALVGNTDSFFTTTLADGANTVAFGDLAQGPWVTGDNKVDFDASQASKIQFQIPATDAGPVTFDFCISDLELTGGPTGQGGQGGATL